MFSEVFFLVKIKSTLNNVFQSTYVHLRFLRNKKVMKIFLLSMFICAAFNACEKEEDSSPTENSHPPFSCGELKFVLI